MVDSYYTWQTFEVSLAGETIRWAGKPGLESWNDVRPSTRLIAEALSVEPGRRVLDLRCGAGVCGVFAAQRGADVTLCDDSLVAVQAAQRTLDLSGARGDVVHGEEVSGEYDVVLLDAPRGREWVRHLLVVAARSLRPGGKLMLAGPNRGGIKGFIEDADEIVGPCQVTSVKAGHRLAAATRAVEAGAHGRHSEPRSGEESRLRVTKTFGGAQGDTTTWPSHQTCQAMVRGQPIRFVTRPGVFSQGGLDDGTRALIEAMEVRPGESVLDLGCGSGVVGLAAAQMGGQVVCVDSSAVALAATRATLELNGAAAQVLASDCAWAVRDMRFDVIAVNPPFHQGLGVEYEVAQQFVRDAARALREGGRLYLVANRFIRYERIMEGLLFGIQTVYQDGRFRVLAAHGKVS